MSTVRRTTRCRASFALLLLGLTADSGCAWRDRPDPPSVAVELGGTATAVARDRLRVVTFNVAMQSADVIAGALPRPQAGGLRPQSRLRHALVTSGPTSPWISMRMDGLYTRRLRLIAPGVDDSVRISDHLPVWADVSLH